jgi:hypothetical protein
MNNIDITKQLISNILHQTLSKSLTPNISNSDIEPVVQLCLFSFYRSGQEDPYDLTKKIPSPLLEHLIKNINSLTENSTLSKITQFLLIEWCWRNDYLNDDWQWEWVGKNEGTIHFNPRIPLNSIPLPTE